MALVGPNGGIQRVALAATIEKRGMGVLFARIVGQGGLVGTQPQFTVRALTKYKGLVHLYLLALAVSHIDIAHGDSDVAMNLDAIFGGVIVVTHLHPVFQGKASVFRKVLVAADEIRECAFLRVAKSVLTKR